MKARPYDPRREFMKHLESLSHRHRMSEVFRDFTAMAYLGMAKATSGKERGEQLDERFGQITRRYRDSFKETPESAFAPLLAHTVNALEIRPHDFLGELFQEIDAANARAGQFFTPEALSRVIAEMTLGDKDAIAKLISEKGYFTVQEPACGSGGMVIQAAEVLKSHGFNPARHMRVTMIDVDPGCFHMAYIQASLLAINARVVLGNTLSLEVSEVAITPMAMLYPWTRETATPAEPAPAPEAPPAITLPPTRTKPEQLALFAPEEPAA